MGTHSQPVSDSQNMKIKMYAGDGAGGDGGVLGQEMCRKDGSIMTTVTGKDLRNGSNGEHIDAYDSVQSASPFAARWVNLGSDRNIWRNFQTSSAAACEVPTVSVP